MLRHISSHQAVCYEQIRLVKAVVGVTEVNSECKVCVDRSYHDCPVCVTVVGPWTEPTSIDVPVTSTILPAPGSGDSITVLILTPTASPASTITVPYTGTSPISAPITVTTQVNSNEPPIVIISTPTSAVAPGFTTITTQGTGLLPGVTTISATGTEQGTVIVTVPAVEPTFTTITIPGTGAVTVTATIQPSGTHPGTVIVEEPTTTTANVSSSQVVTSTASEDPEKEPSPTPTPTPAPEPEVLLEPFSCDDGAYQVSQQILYRIDMDTGDSTIISDSVGPDGVITGIGYNALDNFIYGFVELGVAQYQLIKIDSLGDHEMMDVTSNLYYDKAEMDSTGQLWVADIDNTQWAHVDLNPSSLEYGQLIASGAMQGLVPEDPIGDWAFTANGGPYLWGVTSSTNPVLFRWGFSTQEWDPIWMYGSSISGFNGCGGAVLKWAR